MSPLSPGLLLLIRLSLGAQYLTFTRPDIVYIVQQVCLHMHDPQETRLTVVRLVLRYLQDSLDFWLRDGGLY
jgi:hypothetical protein